MCRHTKTHLWDVSDLENPEFKSTYESNTISIDHNQYVHKNYTWQSNYVSGLQVLYIDQERYDLKVITTLRLLQDCLFEFFLNYNFCQIS